MHKPMSTTLATPEDFAFFDFLAPIRWPNASAEVIAYYRRLVETGEIQIETLLENALVIASNGQYSRVATHGYDFTDFSDAKKVVSGFRCNNIRTNSYMNTFNVSNIKNKCGLLRVMGYSRYSSQFYFFAIPYSAYSNLSVLEIILDRSNDSDFTPLGVPRGKWVNYQVPDFYTLARITHEQAEILPLTRSILYSNDPCTVAV